MRFHALLLLLALTSSACDVAGPDAFVEDYVVESYQIAGDPIASVRLSRTAPIDESFNPTARAVRAADVQIAMIVDGEEREVYRLIESRPGVYESVDAGTVRSGATYRLLIELPDGHRIRAETVVPGDFEIVETNGDVIRYLGPEQLTMRLTPSSYASREPVYLLTSTAMDIRLENLTPTYRGLYDQGAISLDELRVGASPILNEAAYDRDADGLIVIRYPWIGVSFFGFSDVAVNVLDTNLFDFLRTQNVQQGGSTLPPGEIPNVIDHVEGGTGVFGSMARQVFRVQFVP